MQSVVKKMAPRCKLRRNYKLLLAQARSHFFPVRCDSTRRPSKRDPRRKSLGGDCTTNINILYFKLICQLFLQRLLSFTIFENGRSQCHYLKRKKKGKKVVNPYYLQVLLLVIMIFQQCTKLKPSWVGCFLANTSATSFRTLFVQLME